MQANTASAASDEDPDSITKSPQFLNAVVHKIKSNLIYQWLTLFLLILAVNSLVFAVIGSVSTGRIDYIDNVTGEVLDQPELKSRAKASKDRVVARMVVCNLGYPTTVALRQAIHRTMASCAEQQTLAQIAYKESTGGVHLDNPVSSASGPFQFLDSSWTLMCYGNKHNFQAQANCALKLIRSGQANSTWYRWWK